ncbi:6-carboxyhexanoate-CoA ligase [Acrasis kona]|uniref:6-carboxyhexanoate-CoA ligase n=1 Tax=Acrasis kona TaxID=1008807 RepID=A0AAW2YZB8_9EUKA
MRLLGHGQGVKFYASHEVDTQIKSKSEKISSQHVLEWVFENTKNVTRDGFMQFCIQGLSYHKRKDAWDNLTNDDDTQTLGEKCTEVDSSDLNRLYGSPRALENVPTIVQNQIDELVRSDRFMNATLL